MKKDYATPQLYVHGSVGEMTLGSQGPNDPKPDEGNDGCGIGQGQAGGTKTCS